MVLLVNLPDLVSQHYWVRTALKIRGTTIWRSSIAESAGKNTRDPGDPSIELKQQRGRETDQGAIGERDRQRYLR
jgi:hypothetical protein